ncbi:hypothetical protein NY2A_b309L [Paramecium bursaria Chlorella virus NY2A]|uniref:Uncharacterized protein b309L n=1 Tax=Paramecium bursaria Chlorella virus NY2A TaxID=46021 RepID=A7IWI4_PBCVN|nr:hypothetical protein NY2A_b309L [Paramecium bursaria Chlorella virus NY2A]ABT14708.1 hypothetical protein NY2A_b309L [Paramecium bursaria Chlorella virus NY2A]
MTSFHHRRIDQEFFEYEIFYFVIFLRNIAQRRFPHDRRGHPVAKIRHDQFLHDPFRIHIFREYWSEIRILQCIYDCRQHACRHLDDRSGLMGHEFARSLDVEQRPYPPLPIFWRHHQDTKFVFSGYDIVL